MRPRLPLALPKIIDMPPLWLLAFALLLWGLGQVLPWPLRSAAVQGLGTVLVGAGLAMIGLAAWQFRRHRTSIVPHRAARSLITTGVYAVSRNPIYLADALILTGLALRWDIVHGLVLVPVFVQVIARRFIADEEARLRAAFGADFDAYAGRTRRWL